MAETINKNYDNEQALSGNSIKGRFARFTSAFWSLALPAISGRYLFEFLNEFIDPKKLFPNRNNYKTVPKFLANNIYTMTLGTVMMGIITFYGKRTYDDMKTLFAEAISCETGKPKEQIGFMDMFKSKNTIVQTTVKNLEQKTGMRGLFASAYFFPWQVLTKNNLNDNVGYKAGTGSMAAYLFADGFYRNKSFFEALQELVDVKIEHNDSTKINTKIEPDDIMVLSYIYKKSQDKSYTLPVRSSEELRQEREFATRVADLINQTYNNTPKTGHADLTIGKLVHLMGNGFLDKYPENIAYINIANEDIDVFRKCTNPQELASKLQETSINNYINERQGQQIISDLPAIKYTDMVQRTQKRILEARTNREFSAQISGPASPITRS